MQHTLPLTKINIGKLYLILLISTDQSVPQRQIDFTGNWFIDIGILGFINLMEEVYEWDLEDLRNRIKKEPEKVYYKYFPQAFVYYNLMKQNISNLPSPKDNDNVLEASVDQKQIFEESWKFIEKKLFKK